MISNMEYNNENKQLLNTNIPIECKSCPYTVVKSRKHGHTIHCKLEPTHMDVTHVEGRSLRCPLTDVKL